MTGIGHNIDPAAMGMDPAVFHRHNAAMAVAAKKVAEAQAAASLAKKEQKRVRKLFQADGGVQGDYDLALKMRDEDQAVAVARMRRIGAYGKALGALPNAVQLSFLDDVMPDEVMERAERDGMFAGSRGESIETCPHDPTVPQYGAWQKGWAEGRPYFEEALSDAAKIEAGDPGDQGDGDNDEDPFAPDDAEPPAEGDGTVLADPSADEIATMAAEADGDERLGAA